MGHHKIIQYCLIFQGLLLVEVIGEKTTENGNTDSIKLTTRCLNLMKLYWYQHDLSSSLINLETTRESLMNSPSSCNKTTLPEIISVKTTENKYLEAMQQVGYYKEKFSSIWEKVNNDKINYKTATTSCDGKQKCDNKIWIPGCYQCMPNKEGEFPYECKSNIHISDRINIGSREATVKPFLPFLGGSLIVSDKKPPVPSASTGSTLHSYLMPYYDFENEFPVMIEQEALLQTLSSTVDNAEEWERAIQYALNAHRKLNDFLTRARHHAIVQKMDIDFSSLFNLCEDKENTISTSVPPSSSSYTSFTSIVSGSETTPSVNISTTSSQETSQSMSTTLAGSLSSLSSTSSSSLLPISSSSQSTTINSISSNINVTTASYESSTHSIGISSSSSTSPHSSPIWSNMSSVTTPKSSSSYITPSVSSASSLTTTAVSSSSSSTTGSGISSTTASTHEKPLSSTSSVISGLGSLSSNVSSISESSQTTTTSSNSQNISTSSSTTTQSWSKTSSSSSSSSSNSVTPSISVTDTTITCQNASQDMQDKLDDLNDKLADIQNRISKTTDLLKDCIANKTALSDIMQITLELNKLMTDFNGIISEISAIQGRGRNIANARMIRSLRHLINDLSLRQSQDCEIDEQESIRYILSDLDNTLIQLTEKSFDISLYDHLVCDGKKLSYSLLNVVQRNELLNGEDKIETENLLKTVTERISEQLIREAEKEKQRLDWLELSSQNNLEQLKTEKQSIENELKNIIQTIQN